ncbi:hypothetical protein E2C01_016089 [Portunus trituberculatus]|uniref:Uncharacterized protein n=1 Tax=Portunus trituberculatus TaxID=210409 RepID=A0A5B7DN55_PORTR|nr:hypothetical protein [Portunus trituberculatus]
MLAGTGYVVVLALMTNGKVYESDGSAYLVDWLTWEMSTKSLRKCCVLLRCRLAMGPQGGGSCPPKMPLPRPLAPCILHTTLRLLIKRCIGLSYFMIYCSEARA